MCARMSRRHCQNCQGCFGDRHIFKRPCTHTHFHTWMKDFTAECRSGYEDPEGEMKTYAICKKLWSKTLYRILKASPYSKVLLRRPGVMYVYMLGVWRWTPACQRNWYKTLTFSRIKQNNRFDTNYTWNCEKSLCGVQNLIFPSNSLSPSTPTLQETSGTSCWSHEISTLSYQAKTLRFLFL